MKWIIAVLMAMLPALSGAQTTSIKVMSWNIRYNNPEDGPFRWELRREGVGRLITRVNPDILGVQEALFLQVRDLQDGLPGYDYVGVGRNDGGINGEFVPLFYRIDTWELVDQGTYWLSPYPDQSGSIGWDAALPRIATWVLLRHRIHGQQWLIVNTHFDHMGELAREKSAELILSRLGSLPSGVPVVLMGDINDTPGSAAINSLCSHMQDARSIATHVRGPEATYTGFSHPDPTRRIDYIFVDSMSSVDAFVTIPANDENMFLSDHLPIWAKIRYNP